MSRGLYLFCLARSGLLPSFEGRVIDGLGPMTLRSYRDIAAVLSEVSLEDVIGTDGETGLQDPVRTWRRALQHEEVVEKVMCSSSVLPARLDTVFSSWESLERVLRADHETISRFLDRAAGCDEWAVKAFLDRARAKEALFAGKLAQEEHDLAASSPGLRYLQVQRLRKGLGNEASQKMREACLQAEVRLRGHAKDFRRRDVLCPEACGEREMIMNWAFWVPRKNTDAFRECLEDVCGLQAGGGLVLECTGPWPPYSFSPCLEKEAAP